MRKKYSAETKSEALNRYYKDHVSGGVICTEMNIHPSAFYRWKKRFDTHRRKHKGYSRKHVEDTAVRDPLDVLLSDSALVSKILNACLGKILKG